MAIWHTLSADELSGELGVDPKLGLSPGEAAERAAKYGPNELDAGKKRTLFQMFLEQFKDVMVLILIAAALVSFAIEPSDIADPVVILFVIFLNAALGLFQESKAEKALDALKKLAAPQAKVVRGGEQRTVAASELVPGDIILVEAGDFIPADARILECHNLKVEESSLTGESVPVEKHAEAIPSDNVALGDRKNMLFSTGIVTYGRARAVVVETGMNTQVGRIAGMLTGEESGPTPLQARLAQIGRTLGLLALVICVLIFVIGYFLGNGLFEMFKTSVALAVAAIPEGLPAVVTIVLAVGVQRMVKKNAIIRRLPAVETLGSAAVICSDKTGTLTQNRMTVQSLYVAGEPVALSDADPAQYGELLAYGALCNDAAVTLQDGRENHTGDPTESALVAAALKKGFSKEALCEKYPRIAEIPFDSGRKLMTTVHCGDGRFFSITKGAPDVLLSRCVGFDGAESAALANSLMAKNALRILAVGVKEYDSRPDKPQLDEAEQGLRFVGLLGMIDPPRPEVRDAVAQCGRAGIRPVMITGDHADTASAIGRELGILRPGDKVMTGTELSAISDDELNAHISEYAIFARVAPEHKVRIVNAWQKQGAVVAMTGDGVNDAPALKTADIGCAMGITGTDVAKGAAHMILTDDNFATIVSAVREGRGVYQNIRKAVQFLLSSNIGEVLTIFAALIIMPFMAIAGNPSPLLPIHLLWVNLITDSLPALALGMDSPSPDIMTEKPRPKNESFFAHGLGMVIGLQGVVIALITLAAFFLGAKSLDGASVSLGQTMAFTVLAISQLFHAFNVRSRRSVLFSKPFENRYLLGALVIGAALQVAVVATPLNAIFKLVPLTAAQWGISLALSVAIIPLVELMKLILQLFGKKV